MRRAFSAEFCSMIRNKSNTEIVRRQIRFEVADRMSGTKLNQIFLNTKQMLEDILAGYTYPEPHFREILKTNVEKIFSILRDPSLPLLEVEDILSSISERIPRRSIVKSKN